MTSNLDAGTFNITNINQLSNTPTGLISSNGAFQHIASAGSFQIGGADMTTDANAHTKNGVTSVMNIAKSTQKIDVRAGATLDYDPNSMQTFQAGGHNTQLQSNAARATYSGETSTTFQPQVRRDNFLTLTGNAFGNSVIPMCISPMTTPQLYTSDCAIYVPFTAGLGWSSSSNGGVVPLLQPFNHR